MSSSVTADETRRRLEVLRAGVDVALKTLDEYGELLAKEADASVRAVSTTQLRDIMMVLEFTADGMANNAFVDGVDVRVWAKRLHTQLAEEFPDIVQ